VRYPVNDAIQPNMVPAVVIFVGKYLYVYHLRGPDAPDQSVSYGFDRKESEGAEIDGKEQKKESRGRLIHCPGVQSIHNDAGKTISLKRMCQFTQYRKNISNSDARKLDGRRVAGDAIRPSKVQCCTRDRWLAANNPNPAFMSASNQ